MKEDRAKRLYSLQFHLYEVLEQAKSIYCEKNKNHQWLFLGLLGQELSGKGHEGTFWGVGNVLYMLELDTFLHL